MRDDDPEVIVKRISDVKQRREKLGLPPMTYGLKKRVSLDEYSVSNRGLRTGLVGKPEKIAVRIEAFEKVGVDFFLLQCSPQLEEMERFAEAVIAQQTA